MPGEKEKETEWIPDYETLYKFLFNALTDVTQSTPPGQVVAYQELRVIARIWELQSQSEELFIETSRAATGVVTSMVVSQPVANIGGGFLKGYKESFDPRQYHVMIEREQKGRTFKAIGQDLGYSVIQKDNRLSNEDMTYLISTIQKQFGMDDRYINSYLEYNYYDILDTYRDGEPKSTYNVSDYKPREYKSRAAVIEKWRHELMQEEMELLQGANSGQSTKELAASRYMSEKDVEYKLRTAKLTRFRDAVHKLCEATGLTFKEVYNCYSYPQDPFDKRYADLIEQLRKAQAGEPVTLPSRY